MPGKARPSLRIKTLKNVERSSLSLTDKKCIKEIFERFEALECSDSVANIGEWIYNTDDFTPKMRCTICGYNKPIIAGENITQEPSNYCCNCGTKMDIRSDALGESN